MFVHIPGYFDMLKILQSLSEVLYVFHMQILAILVERILNLVLGLMQFVDDIYFS